MGCRVRRDKMRGLILCQDVNTTGTPNSPELLAGTSGLMMAAMSSQAAVVARLVEEEDCDVNMRGLGLNTALTFAAGQGCSQVLLSLLSAGADPAAANSSGKTSLGLAADHARMEDFMDICSNLVAAGATGTEQDWEVLTKHPR